MPQGILSFSTDNANERFLQKQRISIKWTSSLIRNIFIAVIVFCLLMYLVVFFFLDSYVIVIDEQFKDAVPKAVLQKRVDFHSSIIDKMCSDTTSMCYIIKDVDEGSEGVQRHLIIDGLTDSDGSDTSVRLIPPQGQTFETSDTRIWNIDHSRFISQYVAGLFVAPFLVGSLSITGDNVNKSVVEIGLGGGSFDMAMSLMFPQIDITAYEYDRVVIAVAEKWFGVESKGNRRTVYGDGIEAVRNMKRRGVTTDAVILDACDSDEHVPCPSAVFRSKSVISDIKNVLTRKGCLAVNFLIHPNDKKKAQDREVMKVFKDVFPTCLQMRMLDETNVILICLPYAIGDVPEQIKFYRSRLQSAVKSLKLEYILNNVDISSSAL